MNLETSITKSEDKWPNKVFNFKLHPFFCPHLLESNVKHVSLANNHILDFGVKGMIETMKVLDSLNISHCGCGMNRKEAQKFVSYSVPNSNVNIKCFSAADHEFIWDAGKRIPRYKNEEGIWIIDIENENFSEVIDIVSKSKQQNDIIIFSIHWGPNYSWEPSMKIQKLAHALIDAGVDIIHGHSAHHVQRIELYNQGIILYSLGDFVDDYAIDDEYRNDLGCLIEVDIDESNLKKKTVKIHPTKISNFQVNLATDKFEIDRVLKIMKQ
eukprot:gene3043-5053_t